MEILYQTSVLVSGGREGVARSEDGAFELKLSKPSGLGGEGGKGFNPEQLFAAGYAACFLSAIKHVAAEKDVVVPDGAKVKSVVGMGKGNGGFDLDVALQVSIPSLESEQVTALVEAAHRVCPYSRALTGTVEPRIEVSNF